MNAAPGAQSDVPGLSARRLAAQALVEVLHRHRPLDGALDHATLPGLDALPERDRALVRMIVATASVVVRWRSLETVPNP